MENRYHTYIYEIIVIEIRFDGDLGEIIADNSCSILLCWLYLLQNFPVCDTCWMLIFKI